MTCPHSSLSPQRSIRLFTAFLVMLIYGSSVAPAQRNDLPHIQQLQLGFDEKPSGWVKLGAWTPAWTTIAAGAAPFEGSLRITAPDEQGIPSIVSQPVSLARGESRVFVSSIRTGTPQPIIEAQLLTKLGEPVATPQLIKPATEVLWSTKVVAHSAATPGIEQVATLPKFLGADSSDQLVTFVPLSAWPADTIGFDAVSVVVLSSEDSVVLDALNSGKINLLRRWVATGGNLVICLGPHWEEAAKAFGDLLPADPTGTSLVNDVGAIETFAGSGSTPLRQQPTVVKLQIAAGRNVLQLAATAFTPLVVRGAYGLGRVTLTGIDPSTPPISTWPNRTMIWDKLLDLRGRTHDLIGQVSDTRGALIQATSLELAGQIQQSLEIFPNVTLISFGLVAFFVSIYLLLIGPIDYLFLRKVVRRMDRTWITFPAIVALTTLSAWAAAYAFKGTQTRVNKLDFVDVDQNSGQVRGASWWTLYSTANRDYDLSLQPLAPDLRPKTAWALDADQTCTWFSPSQAALVGLGRVALGTRSSDYGPPGRVSRIDGVRVPIWSSRSFTGRWSGRAQNLQLAEADLRVIAGDRVSGSIRNLLDFPMRNAQLYFGNNVYELGTIRPRGIGRVDYARAEAIARHLGRLVQNAERSLRESESLTGDELATRSRKARVDLLRAVLFHNALGTRAENYPSSALAYLDQTAAVVELQRPMLVAEVDAPAAELLLGGDPTKPVVDQTTLIRIVLDLDVHKP
jgi:hypothetical protein